MVRKPGSNETGARANNERGERSGIGAQRTSAGADQAVDTGESRGNIAFCVTLWLAGERFGKDSAAYDAALEQGWSTTPVRSSSLANDIDKALGPAFDDHGVAVDLAVCFDNGIEEDLPPAVHPWRTYRRTAFDDYFASLASRLDDEVSARLIDKLGGAIPKNSGFNGMEGFPFHGVKSSFINESGRRPAVIRNSANTMFSGIGPDGELIPQFRRVGSMQFTDEGYYEGYWPFSVPAGSHPTEQSLWDKKLKDSLLDADVDKEVRGGKGQIVHRTQPNRLMDYLVCLPYTVAWKLMNDHTPHLDSRGAAALLKRMFLRAYQDSDFAAFGDAQRAALAGQPWPVSALDTAALIAASLVDFALGRSTLADSVTRTLRRELSRQTAYLESLQDWACEITERDGASVKADRLEDVYVAPLFSDANPVNWLFNQDAPSRLLLQAGSGMGKSTFLRATAAACASARLARISLALGGAVANEEAVRFSLAFARSANNDANRFELREGASAAVKGDGAGDDRAGRCDAGEGGTSGIAGILSDEELARMTGLAQLSAYTPILLSQTRNEALYNRLFAGDGHAMAFSDIAYEALPETMRSTLRDAAFSGGGEEGNPIDALVERGGVLLMVDSIDEIPRKYRALYLRRLREFANQEGIVRLLVASRPLPSADDAALRSMLGRGALRARLEEFDLPRQEELFARVTTRGGADAYDGPSFSSVRATAGFRGVMGNPFMLTAIALAFKRGRASDRRSVWGTFSEINNKFRKRTTLNEYDSAALEHLAFDLTLGSPVLPSSEFIEKFRAYRNDEVRRQAYGADAIDIDEDDLVDLIMSRLGIIDIRDNEVGFPYAAVRGFWASLWIRRCVQRAQGSPLSMMDIDNVGATERALRFEQAGSTGADQMMRLLRAVRPTECADDANGGSGTDGESSINEGRRGDAALLAMLFTLEYAGTPAHPDYPAFDEMRGKAYTRLLNTCASGDKRAYRSAVRVLKEAAAFAFGEPLAGYVKEASPYLGRLTAFTRK